MAIPSRRQDDRRDADRCACSSHQRVSSTRVSPTSKRTPSTPFGLEPRLDSGEVVKSRHLQQAQVAFHDPNAAARALDERCAVGSRRQDPPHRPREASRLGMPAASAPSRGRSVDRAVTTPSATRFTVSATGRPGTTPSHPSASGSSTRPSTASATRARRIVDDDSDDILPDLRYAGRDRDPSGRAPHPLAREEADGALAEGVLPQRADAGDPEGARRKGRVQGRAPGDREADPHQADEQGSQGEGHPRAQEAQDDVADVGRSDRRPQLHRLADLLCPGASTRRTATTSSSPKRSSKKITTASKK